MSIKKLRKLLEGDLGREQGALDDFKSLLRELVDQVLHEPDVEPDVEPPAKKLKQAAAQPKRKAPANENAMPAAGIKRKEVERKAEPAPNDDNAEPKDAEDAKPAKAREPLPQGVERLRQVCRQAGISIGPSIYKKGPSEQTACLQLMLEKQGLHKGSKPREIAKVKKRLEMEKDLADIDSSNIVGQRRTRQHVNYAAIDKLSGSESSSGSGEGRAAVQPSASPVATGTASDDTVSEDFQAGGSSSKDDEGAAQTESADTFK